MQIPSGLYLAVAQVRLMSSSLVQYGQGRASALGPCPSRNIPDTLPGKVIKRPQGLLPKRRRTQLSGPHFAENELQ